MAKELDHMFSIHSKWLHRLVSLCNDIIPFPFNLLQDLHIVLWWCLLWWLSHIHLSRLLEDCQLPSQLSSLLLGCLLHLEEEVVVLT